MRVTESQYRALRAGKRIPQPRRGQKHEDLLAWQFDREGIRYEREHRFLADRKFRFDFAIRPLALKIAVEVDGGVHRIKTRFGSDREKGNLALLTGWRVLHVEALQVRSGSALALTKRLLELAA